ncbi:SDR family oxidoreductase [Ancylothrix sp. C2]|uniref:SDR family oxidoreductase n=1 Tax=Ancylothrix sp. D3o TaxID=2953691 RepID=UPI0021BB470A|nr:SDR family oxidoreductase [Ancylothrix sp. D3o]MCT7949038.1 SDR family oxidoreductase [Ancylothrix sp. D3o]
MTTTTHIFLAGASRGVGAQLAYTLSQHNQKITALLRSETTKAQLESMGLNTVLGDALDAKAMENIMQECQPIDVVISTIGGLPKEGQRADYLGNKNLVDAAVKAGVKKFILVSSIGAGNSKIALSPQVLETLGAVLIEKEKAEQHLINSGLTYTIIRPGGLKSEPATGNGILTEDERIAGTIHRPDVAHLVWKCLCSEQSHNKIFSAIDRNMAYGQLEIKEFTF